VKPWFKFYPHNWRGDAALRMCSLAARGLWMEMISIMHGAEPYGHLLVNGLPVNEKQLASLSGAPLRETVNAIAELESCGVFSRTADGTIYSRKMVRDYEKEQSDRSNGKQGGSPDLIGGSVAKEARSRRISRKDNPTKVEAVWAASSGLCKGCGCQMQRAGGNAPDAFTIDHIIPIAHGGTNDLENLQALCRSCNRRKGITPLANYIGDGGKPQKLEARGQKEGEGDHARGSPPDLAFSDSLLRIIGQDPQNPEPGYYDANRTVQKWLNAGWDHDTITASIREQLARKRDGPPSRINYFENGIARAIALQRAPLPEVKIVPQTTLEVRRAAKTANTPTDGIRAVREQLLGQGSSGLCPGSGGTDVRLLPPGRGE
jgi:hypothetical protein